MTESEVVEFKTLRADFDRYCEETRNYRKEQSDQMLRVLLRIEHLDETERHLSRLDKQIEDLYARLWKIALIVTAVASSVGIAAEKLF